MEIETDTAEVTPDDPKGLLVLWPTDGCHFQTGCAHSPQGFFDIVMDDRPPDGRHKCRGKVLRRFPFTQENIERAEKWCDEKNAESEKINKGK